MKRTDIRVCMETRKKNGMTWRRYREPDGRFVRTYELPESVLFGLATRAEIAKRLAQFERGEASRARIARIHALLDDGWKPSIIVDEFPELSRERVLKICAAYKREEEKK